MFTGIIEASGEVAAVKRKAALTEIVVKNRVISNDSAIGDSIAINGVCLTISAKDGDNFSFEVSEETLRKSTLSTLTAGSFVNLETAMKPTGKFGGHIVTGHVDGVGQIESIRDGGGSMDINIEAPEEVMRYVVKKGSITIDGISLTVARLKQKGFTVVIIPHTAKVTNLGSKKIGDSVNLEADIIGKYVEKFVGKFNSQTEENKNRSFYTKLQERGFIK